MTSTHFQWESWESTIFNMYTLIRKSSFYIWICVTQIFLDPTYFSLLMSVTQQCILSAVIPRNIVLTGMGFVRCRWWMCLEGPEHCALGNLLGQGCWTRWPPVVPSNLKHCYMVIWNQSFHEIQNCWGLISSSPKQLTFYLGSLTFSAVSACTL